MLTEQEVQALGCENGEYDGPPAFPESWRILQDPWEISQCLEYVESHLDYIDYLEIGLGHGGLFRLVNSLAKVDFAMGIDDRRAARFSQSLAIVDVLFRSESRVKLLFTNSRSQTARIAIRQNEFNFAFIDGDHSAQGVSHDLSLILPSMKPGGFVALHDTIYYGAAGGVARVLGAVERGEWPSVRVVQKWERQYGIALLEVRQCIVPESSSQPMATLNTSTWPLNPPAEPLALSSSLSTTLAMTGQGKESSGDGWPMASRSCFSDTTARAA